MNPVSWVGWYGPGSSHRRIWHLNIGVVVMNTSVQLCSISVNLMTQFSVCGSEGSTLTSTDDLGTTQQARFQEQHAESQQGVCCVHCVCGTFNQHRSLQRRQLPR